MIDLRVTCRVHQGDGPAPGKIAQLGNSGVAGQFFLVAAGEFLESFRLVAEPDSQLWARGDVFHPIGEFRVDLLDTPWPKPIDEHANAVRGRGVLVGAFDENGHFSTQLTPEDWRPILPFPWACP